MRLTHRTRLLNQARRQIEAEMTAALYTEFRWLWRQLYPAIRQLKSSRDGLVKFEKADSGLWAIFQQRVTESLSQLITEAAERLAVIEQVFWQSRGREIRIDPKEIVARYETELVQQDYREIADIANTTRREMGQRIAAWYNQPGATTQSLVDQLKPYVSETRADAIATTEVTWLNGQVTQNTMEQLGVTEYTWQSMRDELVCTKPVDFNGQMWAGCRELHGKVFPVGTFRPAHVRCRCFPNPKVV